MDNVADTPVYGPAVVENQPHQPVVPIEDLGSVPDSAARGDAVEILVAQSVGRVENLVPIRYGRMLVDEFAFYRGSAALMATDLAATSDSGLTVQLCGDAHLSNFGAFASPERNLLFDINDFDETAEGPFEWDLKRLVASFEIAGVANEFGGKARREILRTVTETYRESMAQFATMGLLNVWYSRLDLEATLDRYRDELHARDVKKTAALVAKARTRDSMSALAKLATIVGGMPRMVDDPPIVETVEKLFPNEGRPQIMDELQTLIHEYSATLSTDRRHLLSGYRLVDAARKVVGVGSVGTRCWILLCVGASPQDVLLLQAKEANRSVLDVARDLAPQGHQGERVVKGQRLMQAASDIFLGFQTVTRDDTERHFYVRQLRDWKASYDINKMTPAGLTMYARMCGWTLARAHARSGDAAAIAAYLGDGVAFDAAMQAFARAYAELNAQDYGKLKDAADQGRIAVRAGL